MTLTNLASIPQLNTEMVAPLLAIERQFLGHRQAIEEWFQSQWLLTKPPVYGSLDLRNAGFKLAPIDMNLFPAGFNNLNKNFLDQTIAAAQKSILNLVPNAKNILLIPEGHTRNLFYWANIQTLQTILEGAGFKLRFGLLDTLQQENLEIKLENGDVLIIEPLKREKDRLTVHGFSPDVILLNNDLSEGIPEILQHLSQPLIPPAELGWSQRLKSEHFNYYAQVTNEFAKLVQIDPWLITPLFRHCGEINFMQQDGMSCVIKNAEALFAEIQKKYAEYQIPYQPFLVVKADAGTYGMAVMTVRNIEELQALNRKQRTKMATTKGGQPVNRVIIQEGVYSFETYGPEQLVAEPVVYLWGSCVVGGFYRMHKDRGPDENLNAPGMRFEPLAFTQTCNEPREDMAPDACQNRFYVYGTVARLSMLAAAREIKDQAK